MELPIISKILYDNKKNAYKKQYICNKCNYNTCTLWDLKKHTANIHITIKEKKKLPYYCIICDSISISQLYYDKHIDSDNHKNKIKSFEIKPFEIKPFEIKENINKYHINTDIKQYIEAFINKLKEDINILKDDINKLKDDINKLKINNLNSNTGL